jgi:hypothetical protein
MRAPAALARTKGGLSARAALAGPLSLAWALALTPASSLAQAAPEAAGAPPPLAASAGPPVQRIESASAISSEPLGAVSSVRELRDGRLLVNDGVRRRLLLMDSTMTMIAVVLDSVSEVANTYGPRAGALLPYRGDSILFVDPASYAMVVLDPEARPTRVRSIWRVEDVTYVTSATGLYGFPGLDGQGRIVYRIPAQAAPPRVPPPAGVPYFPPVPDSAFLVAVDLDTRRRDTLGVVKTPRSERNIRVLPSGGFTIESVLNPLPLTDDWAVLADGRVAIVRGLDYRIDYLHPDGRWTSSEKLPLCSGVSLNWRKFFQRWHTESLSRCFLNHCDIKHHQKN